MWSRNIGRERVGRPKSAARNAHALNLRISWQFSSASQTSQLLGAMTFYDDTPIDYLNISQPTEHTLASRVAPQLRGTIGAFWTLAPAVLATVALITSFLSVQTRRRSLYNSHFKVRHFNQTHQDHHGSFVKILFSIAGYCLVALQQKLCMLFTRSVVGDYLSYLPCQRCFESNLY